jgi:hypothetical protein
MSKVVLSRGELDGMRATLEDLPPDRAATDKRATLKKLSQERQSHWPNTLDATRKKREQAFADKECVAEAHRQVQDKEEAELRRVERLHAIGRANDLLYEQTDCMKVLRSKELLSDCLHDRKYQMADKEQVKVVDREREASYHQVVLQTVRGLEGKEKEKEAANLKRIADVAVVREDQLRQVRGARAAHATEQIAIGEHMRRDAEALAEEEQRNAVEKARTTKEKNYEFMMGNEQLKEIKRQMKIQDDKDGEKREAEVGVIENRKKVRKALEHRKFDKAQQTRLRMIEKATEILAAKATGDNALLNRQVNELREKEDKYFADKETHREAEWDKTIQSRRQQVQAKKDRTEVERKEEESMIDNWRRVAGEENDREERKIQKAHHDNVHLKKLQKAQGLERDRSRHEMDLLDAERERLYRDKGDEEDARFKEICKKEIQRYAADGKPLYPLYRALEYKQPDILAVSGFRI